MSELPKRMLMRKYSSQIDPTPHKRIKLNSSQQLKNDVERKKEQEKIYRRIQQEQNKKLLRRQSKEKQQLQFQKLIFPFINQNEQKIQGQIQDLQKQQSHNKSQGQSKERSHSSKKSKKSKNSQESIQNIKNMSEKLPVQQQKSQKQSASILKSSSGIRTFTNSTNNQDLEQKSNPNSLMKPRKIDKKDRGAPQRINNFKNKNKLSDNKKEKESKQIEEPPSHRQKNILVTRGVDCVPVDLYFSRRDQAKVLQLNKYFYSVTLTQSNLAKDDNKFFIIQILEVGPQPYSEYYLFSRWGRVGVPGQVSQNGPLQRKQAIRQYNSKSQGKVKNGGYKIVQMTYQHENLQSSEIDVYFKNQNSKLSQQVQQLIKLIFDIKMIHSHMKDIGYDQKRSPLGLIAKASIEKGYMALDKIMKIIKKQIPIETTQSEQRRMLNQHSSQFYSAIPHDFGYMNMKAFVLNSEQKVKQKLQMLSSLSQIQIYSDLMREKSQDKQMSDVEVKYTKLRCEITPLGRETVDYKVINKYIENTHGKTHDKFAIQLLGIFNLRREDEWIRYRTDLKNKMLLWHGSRLTNFVGILSEGLKIAPYQAPATGYMFGKGIYFADIVSKSANYCLPKNNTVGLMLLCEVALGQTNDKKAADYSAHFLPNDKNSTRGVGKNAPSSGEYLDGVWVPNGPLLQSGVEDTPLLYNQFVVYNRDQIRCRYIVYVKFHSKT